MRGGAANSGGWKKAPATVRRRIRAAQTLSQDQSAGPGDVAELVVGCGDDTSARVT